MRKIFLNISVLFLLVFSAFSATAADRGRWLCAECYIGDIRAGQDVGSVLGDVTSFIAYEVNKSVNRWQPNDTVTVCNGSMCVMMFYHAAGKWFALGPPIVDNKSKYENSIDRVDFRGITSRSIAGLSYRVEVTGYWVSVNVSVPQTGESSSGDRFIVTGVNVVVMDNPAADALVQN